MTRQPPYRANLGRDGHGRWHVRKMVSGRVHHRSFRTRKSAQQYLDWLELLAAGVPMRDPVPTLDAACAAYLARLEHLGRSSETARYYASSFAQLQRALPSQLPLDQIHQRDIDRMLAARRANGVNPRTLNKHMADLRRVYKHAGVEPSWRYETMTGARRVRWVRPPDDVARLWQHLDDPARCAVGLGLLAGLRAAEIHRAEASWCLWDAAELRVPPEAKKEGEAQRTALVDTLAAILPRTGRLVRATTGQVGHALQRASAAADIAPPYRGAGAFRHHCATWAVEAGVDRAKVREVLSHSIGGVTDRYIHRQAVTIKRQVLEVVEAAFVDALERVTAELQSAAPTGTETTPGARDTKNDPAS